jgi:hypothetical protein
VRVVADVVALAGGELRAAPEEVQPPTRGDKFHGAPWREASVNLTDHNVCEF